MRQYKISTQDLTQSNENDCVLSPEDPIHQLMGPSQLGGLGGMTALNQYKALQQWPVVGTNKGQIQREQNIKPGTSEWFKLWFGKDQGQ